MSGFWTGIKDRPNSLSVFDMSNASTKLAAEAQETDSARRHSWKRKRWLIIFLSIVFKSLNSISSPKSVKWPEQTSFHRHRMTCNQWRQNEAGMSLCSNYGFISENDSCYIIWEGRHMLVAYCELCQPGNANGSVNQAQPASPERNINNPMYIMLKSGRTGPTHILQQVIQAKQYTELRRT